MQSRILINVAFLLCLWCLFSSSLSPTAFDEGTELGRLISIQHCCFFLSIIVAFLQPKIILNNIVIPMLLSCCLSILGEYNELASVGIAFSIHAALFPFYCKFFHMKRMHNVKSAVFCVVLNCMLPFIKKTSYTEELPTSLLTTSIFYFFCQSGILELEIVSFIVFCAFHFLKNTSVDPNRDYSIPCIFLSISTFVGGAFLPAVVGYTQILTLGKFSKYFYSFLVIVGLTIVFFPISEFYVHHNFIVFVWTLACKNLYPIFFASAYWIIIIGISSLFASVVMDRYKWSRVWGRKVFHIAIVFILVPTLLFPALTPFTCLSLGGVIYLFSALEFFRLVVFPEEMVDISAYFGKFLVGPETLNGEKNIVMAHFSLVLACTFPIWIGTIVNYYDANYPYLVKFGHLLPKLFPFVGVISVGIGDSMAAIVGSMFGKKKWPGQSKSYLGSLSCFFSLVFCFSVISFVLSLEIDFPLLAFASFVTTMGEVCISGNDNFSLPPLFVFSCMCFNRIFRVNGSTQL